MDYRIDEIDKRILYHLGRDARNASAPAIADEVDVTPGTIRNRINQLEDHGIIRGYPSNIDFEKVDGRTKFLFTCTAPVQDRNRLSREALEIPGVIHIRELMAGRENLNITAVGTNTDDTSRIAQELSNLNLTIEAEDVIQNEHHHPYHPFGPEEDQPGPLLTDYMSLAGGAEVIELTVSENAPVIGKSLEEAGAEDLIDEDILILGIERGNSVLTPKGNTTIRAGDVLTVFSRGHIHQETVQALNGEAD